MTNIKYARGPDGPFIVENDGIYLLVNIECESVTTSTPEDDPTKFLRLGYFDEVQNLPKNMQFKIAEILLANGYVL